MQCGAFSTSFFLCFVSIVIGELKGEPGADTGMEQENKEMEEDLLSGEEHKELQEEADLKENILSEHDLNAIQEHVSQMEDSDGSRDIGSLPRMGFAEFPASYTSNSPKEQVLLGLAENFWRQYAFLYPDRQPLFLTPLNECGVEKLVCTTLRPTLLPQPELYYWDECARFVSEYLTMETLNPPQDLPPRLFSSSTVLCKQQGNCFDVSELLCSLLLGAGYDAFCVSGYATREMCLMDETRKVCPLLQTSKESNNQSPVKLVKKYSVKAPRQFISKFESEQKAKQDEQVQAAVCKQEEEEEQRLEEAENPASDPLYGRRVHCWVLVLSGKREVPENFFIDSLTGSCYGTKDNHFLGIESLWNHENYWINMQDCHNGCKDMKFDLGDPVCWEFLLLGTFKPQLLLPEGEEDDGEEQEHGSPAAVEILSSWVLPILISRKEFESRRPQGRKVLQYKKAKLEKWAPFLQENGHVSRLTIYQDRKCSQALEIQDWFQHRWDWLYLKHHKNLAGVTSEYFFPGRTDALKVHVYRTLVPESERRMEFYWESRLDGLEARDEKLREMTETFEGRSDLLCYRHTLFGKRPKKVAIAGAPTEANPRPILKITERFHRNKGKSADQDMAERTFLITEDRIQLRCHREDDRITNSNWEFLKPPNLKEKGSYITLTPETAISYQVNPSESFTKQLYVYEHLLSLQQDEESVMKAVRESEDEVLKILSVCAQEEADPQFVFSIYDTERNEKIKLQREAMERTLQEEQEQCDAKDYLAPFLAKHGDPVKLTRKQAQEVKDDCLNDDKQRQIEKANLIQARFEKETQELQRKQLWYQQNQVSMSKQDEQSYVNYCSEAMFRIQILDKRLSRHKELAPQKYLAVEERLSKDPRLSEPFLTP
uniref:Dynein regulatory complex subunit 7 n=1 Tax=Leptobrachium leishanense TaxID=445787 RepID=A0A8C5QQA0_9ANUR